MTAEKRLVPPLAVASGMVWALCFGRQGYLVAPWLALVPFLLLLRWRRPGLSGFLFGMGYWLVAVPWIRPTVETYGRMPGWLAAIALLAAAAYLSIYSALFGFLVGRIRRAGPSLALFAIPAAWVTLETARGGGPMAFPWNLAGYAAVEVPGALAITAWIGSWGLSFVVVAVNAALALAIERRDSRPALAAGGAAAALLGIAALAGAGAGDDAAASPSHGGRARLLQPNSTVTVDFDERLAVEGYRRLVAQSEAVCATGPGLIVWPESAAWPYSYQLHAQLREDIRRLAGRGCPVLLNSTMRDGEATYNSVYLVTEERAQRYDKRLLVPFGETVPFSRWLPGLRAIARTAGGFTPGLSDALLDWSGERFGLSICFEIVFPAKVARQTRRGATVLLTVTNDGWYGDSSAPWQHFRAARFRAAENRRQVLRAAITGVSGVIAPDGSVERLLGVGERGELATRLISGSRLTFFSRFPWLVPVLCWCLLAFAIFRGFRRPSASA